MKHLMLMSAFLAPSAFAGEDVPATALAEALFNRAEAMLHLQKQCPSHVSEVSSEKLEDGYYKHRLVLRPMGRGDRRKDCVVYILQDYRPTYADGPVSYDIVIAEPAK